MKGHDLRQLGKFQLKKTLKFDLELNFNHFQERKKWKRFKLIDKTFSLFGLTLLVCMSIQLEN